MKSPEPCDGITARFVHKEQKPEATLVRIGRPDDCEFHLTFQQFPGESIEALFHRIACSFQQLKATPVLQFTFGSIPALRQADAAMREVFGEPAWPIAQLDGAGCADGGLAGVQFFAVSERRVSRLNFAGRIVGSVYESAGIRHCLLGNVGPVNGGSKAEQADETFRNMEKMLQEAGFGIPDLMRTWFFLDDLLSWYGDFNRVRTAVYDRHSFRSGSLPASTGVAARNAAGTALALSAWAVQPIAASCSAREVVSPLQCPATSYRSSFSRAVEITALDGRRLTISGTASIAPDGSSVHQGELREQIDLTMKVVHEILRSRGMEFSDVTRAIGYFKHAQHAMAFREWCHARRIALPGLITRCDICRDELLFEIELDAAAPL